jgi:hypothetical protein
MNQTRQTRGRSYSSSPIIRKRGTRSNVAKYDCLLLRAPNKLKKTTARLRSFYSTALRIWGQKSTKTKQLLMQKDYTVCHVLLVMTAYYIYVYSFSISPFLQNHTMFNLPSTPHAVHYSLSSKHPTVSTYNLSQRFSIFLLPRRTARRMSKCAKHLRNDVHIREILEKWCPHARNTCRMTSTYAKYLKNDVHMRETLEEWRPHTRNTPKNDFHKREILEECCPHTQNTWGMTSKCAKHLKKDVHNTFTI